MRSVGVLSTKVIVPQPIAEVYTVYINTLMYAQVPVWWFGSILNQVHTAELHESSTGAKTLIVHSSHHLSRTVRYKCLSAVSELHLTDLAMDRLIRYL